METAARISQAAVDAAASEATMDAVGVAAAKQTTVETAARISQAAVDAAASEATMDAVGVAAANKAVMTAVMTVGVRHVIRHIT